MIQDTNGGSPLICDQQTEKASSEDNTEQNKDSEEEFTTREKSQGRAAKRTQDLLTKRRTMVIINFY